MSVANCAGNSRVREAHEGAPIEFCTRSSRTTEWSWCIALITAPPHIVRGGRSRATLIDHDAPRYRVRTARWMVCVPERMAMSRCGFFLSAKADLLLSHGQLSSDCVRFRGGVASGGGSTPRIGRNLARASAPGAIPGGKAVSTCCGRPCDSWRTPQGVASWRPAFPTSRRS